DRRSVRQSASERDPLTARRRSPADREPAANLGECRAVSGTDRVTGARLALVVAAAAIAAGPAVGLGGSQRRELAPGAPQAGPRVLRVGMARRGGGYSVTSIPLETYVARVIAGEAARDSEPAALEALAIAVRTFALANISRHRADGFD